MFHYIPLHSVIISSHLDSAHRILSHFMSSHLIWFCPCLCTPIYIYTYCPYPNHWNLRPAGRFNVSEGEPFSSGFLEVDRGDLPKRGRRTGLQPWLVGMASLYEPLNISLLIGSYRAYTTWFFLMFMGNCCNPCNADTYPLIY